MADVPRDRQNRTVTSELDVGTLRFDPQPGLVTIYQLHFDSARRIFSSQACRDRFAKQGPIRRLHQVGDFPTH
jgi:hypothetical protein